MVIAVLAVQGAFVEHEQMLERMNIPYVELRKKDDLFQKYDGAVKKPYLHLFHKIFPIQ